MVDPDRPRPWPDRLASALVTTGLTVTALAVDAARTTGEAAQCASAGLRVAAVTRLRRVR